MGDDAPLWGAIALAEASIGSRQWIDWRLTLPIAIYQSYQLPSQKQLLIEIINPNIIRGRIRHALFDFDGTLSLIREGWQDVMIPQMVEWLLETPDHESEAELTAVVKDYVTRLTGKQTIYQMIQLAEEISKRGGQPQDPLDYKYLYLDALWQRIQHRVADLKAGRIPPDDMMVPGSRAMLEALR